jgi:hypothetical protein
LNHYDRKWPVQVFRKERFSSLREKPFAECLARRRRETKSGPTGLPTPEPITFHGATWLATNLLKGIGRKKLDPWAFRALREALQPTVHVV